MVRLEDLKFVNTSTPILTEDMKTKKVIYYDVDGTLTGFPEGGYSTIFNGRDDPKLMSGDSDLNYSNTITPMYLYIMKVSDI
jgi:hypothetical protein